MKNAKNLKLGQLSKDALEKKEMTRLYGGEYCAFEGYNREANNDAGVCSCNCGGSDYYGSNGLDYLAGFYKYFG